MHDFSENVKRDLFITEQQYVPWCDEVFCQIQTEALAEKTIPGAVWVMTKAFSWGVIYGKREERARRKKQQETR